MVSRGNRKGTFRFAYRNANGVREVHLAGDFNRWTPQKMKKQREGLYVLILPLTPGRHQYKFLADGQWLMDADNPEHSLNELGTLNSVLQAE